MLFILSLFLIVLIALEMEVLLAPSAIFLVLGAASLIFGLLVIGYGNLRKRTDKLGHPNEDLNPDSGEKKPKGSPACLSTVVGGMYLLIGAWDIRASTHWLFLFKMNDRAASPAFYIFWE